MKRREDKIAMRGRLREIDKWGRAEVVDEINQQLWR